MLKVFKGLKDLLKQEEVVIDGPVFRFHNVFVALVFFASSLIVTATQLVGTPIQCISQADKEWQKPINTFCWINSTYTLPHAFDKEVGIEVAAPGVSHTNGESAPKYYPYYQWVCFVLFFQGICCYFPKWLWDNCEGGLMKALVAGLRHHLYPDKERKQKEEVIVNYLLNHIKTHRMYAVRYWFCESICFINVLAQMYLMDKFFDGEFLRYGLNVLHITDDPQAKRRDPMIYVFPRLTKCDFNIYGKSGTVQNLDALCVLPINVVNEKIYILVWFLFIFLVGILTMLMLYRVCLIMCPPLRLRLLNVRRKISSRRDAYTIASNLDVGDWWVLYMLGKNIDRCIYNEIVVDLASKLEDPDGTLKR